jgi:manganese/zinc/iron transport system permease protein
MRTTSANLSAAPAGPTAAPLSDCLAVAWSPLLLVSPPLAARFNTDVPLARHVAQFFRDLIDRAPDGSWLIGTTDLVVFGAILLGITSGVLGCFVVLRRQSLLGDAIGHSMLPGVCLGFLLAGSRSTPALLAGAMAFGLLAAVLIAALQRTSVLKVGECTGAVFTGLYGLGIVLLTLIQKEPAPTSLLGQFGIGGWSTAGQAGLDKFLFGQIVGISRLDVTWMAVITGMVLLLLFLFWRPLSAWTFDEGFAFSLGLPVRFIQYGVMTLVTVAIVISIQAVGVVLVAAMLVTPASTAYLLTDRLYKMVLLSALFGATAGVLGAFFSLFGSDLPTGSFMVLGASSLFAGAFLFSPRHGVLPRILRVWARRRRTQAENLLRTLYLLSEKRGNGDERFGVDDVAAARQESRGQVRHLWKLARSFGYVDPATYDPMILTELGQAEAKRVVRNHRLWELFLTQEARLASDHVHADAEHIEHILPRDVLERLEQLLENPKADPHGRPIP